jgi:DNA mismatch repair ATPase MutL
MAGERVLDLFDRRFVIARTEDTLMIVDLAQAYAALNRERLLACLVDAPAAGGRPLLFPLAADVPAVDASLRERRLQALTQLGFDVQWEATGALQLRGVPAALVEADPEDLLAALAQVLPDAAEVPGSNTWIARLADAIPLPRDCRPQKVLDEIRRRGIDTTHWQRCFDGEQLSRLLLSST